MSHPRQPYSHVRTDRHKALTTVANETISVLPEILQAIPSIDASASTIYDLGNLASLTPESCPQYTITLDDKSTKPGIITQVVNMDTLDCAIALGNLPRRPSTRPSPQRFPSVCVLNLASDTTPGGGWLRGYLAQEESICYRSSLYLSLHKGYYPLSPTSAIYTNSAVIIRSSYASGHNLLNPNTRPRDLPVISVISVAALRDPITSISTRIINSSVTRHEGFAHPSDRHLTKSKMRLSLRIAASRGHTKLVLGALGCGAFKNPTEDVALCWREVLSEREFMGGWFEDVVFAVLDRGSDGRNGGIRMGNYEPFMEMLGGWAFVEGGNPVKVGNARGGISF